MTVTAGHDHVWKSMESDGVHWIGCWCGMDSGTYELQRQALADAAWDAEHPEQSEVIYEADLRACDLCGEPGVGEDHPECLADEEGARFP